MRSEAENITLLGWLMLDMPDASKTTLKEMLSAGRIIIGGRRARSLSQPISADDEVRILPRAAVQPRHPKFTLRPLKLIFEDADILVIDKPAGLLTSTNEREKRPTALAIVREYVRRQDPKARVGLIHRLDRDASGLLVFSKSHLAYQSLKTQFFKHSVERIYEAIVHGKPSPPKGTIDTRLMERADGSVYSTDEHAKGQRAVTEYETLDTKSGHSRVRVQLLTGRKHQIRVHLSERGHAIVGDSMYGDKKDPPPLMLRAVKLVIEHPKTGKKMTFEAAPAR